MQTYKIQNGSTYSSYTTSEYSIEYVHVCINCCECTEHACTHRYSIYIYIRILFCRPEAAAQHMYIMIINNRVYYGINTLYIRTMHARASCTALILMMLLIGGHEYILFHSVSAHSWIMMCTNTQNKHMLTTLHRFLLF